MRDATAVARLAAGAYGVGYSAVGACGPGAGRAVHAAGKKIMVWTVNRAERMRVLAEWGVDAIISDDTELLVRLRGPIEVRVSVGEDRAGLCPAERARTPVPPLCQFSLSLLA